MGRSPANSIEAEERRIRLEFIKMLKQTKLDPAIRSYSDMVSGLYENDEWVFVCSQHLSGRFLDEKVLKRHFAEESHRRSSYVLG